MKRIIVVMILLSLIHSCKKDNDNEYVATKHIENPETHPGKKLMETNCYVCHSATANHEDRLAPPMIAVKKRYLKGGMNKKEFINSLQNWIKNPTTDNVKMYGAIERFGIMPKLVYPEDTIELIGDYMFDYEIDQPEWFESHYNSEKEKGQMLQNRNRKQGI